MINQADQKNECAYEPPTSNNISLQFNTWLLITMITTTTTMTLTTSYCPTRWSLLHIFIPDIKRPCTAMFSIIIYLCNLDDVDDGHWDVDVDRDVYIVDLVKTEWSNLLVVIVLENTFNFWKLRIANKFEFGCNKSISPLLIRSFLAPIKSLLG